MTLKAKFRCVSVERFDTDPPTCNVKLTRVDKPYTVDSTGHSWICGIAEIVFEGEPAETAQIFHPTVEYWVNFEATQE